MACINYKCVDPCKNACGLNAVCNVYNHIAICECPTPLRGDAFIACRPVIGKSLYVEIIFKNLLKLILPKFRR